MTRAVTDERRRRWRASIDLQAGITQVRPVDSDPRPSPQASALLDVVRRPARTEPEHTAPEPERAPLQPWARGGMIPAAQPQDSDRRAGTDLRFPPSPDLTTASTLSEEITDRVVGRVREMLGLRPEDQPVAQVYGENPVGYAQLNPAGAFVHEETAPAEVFTPTTQPNPAGSFATED